MKEKKAARMDLATVSNMILVGFFYYVSCVCGSKLRWVIKKASLNQIVQNIHFITFNVCNVDNHKLQIQIPFDFEAVAWVCFYPQKNLCSFSLQTELLVANSPHSLLFVRLVVCACVCAVFWKSIKIQLDQKKQTHVWENHWDLTNNGAMRM